MNAPQYERPNGKYRCGRLSLWGKSCTAGPSPGGKCGGVADCIPRRKCVDREKGIYVFECARAAEFGGKCRSGPLPDGHCLQTHPPCCPQPTLRLWRGRFTVLAAAGTASAILAMVFLGSAKPYDHGPISSVHAVFTATQGCQSCHTGRIGNWNGFIAFHGKDEFIAKCAVCHEFNAAWSATSKSTPPPDDRLRLVAATAHNAPFGLTNGVSAVSCEQCHLEHRGDAKPVLRVTDQTCNACHHVQFASFSSGHPAFGDDYPRTARPTIHFDHQKHYADHFKDPQKKAFAPTSCLECHQFASASGRSMRTAGFDTACAACHADQIRDDAYDLTLISVPIPIPELRGDPDGYHFTGFMEGVLEAGTSAASRTQAVATLLQQLESSGLGALSNLVVSGGLVRSPDQVGPLFVGLQSASLAPVANAWNTGSTNSPVETGIVMNAQSLASGWYWREVPQDSWNLSYKPAGHADPVAKAWIEMAGQANGGQRFEKLQSEILSPNSPGDSKPGRCLKCHVTEPTTHLVPLRRGKHPHVTLGPFEVVTTVHWNYPDELPSSLTVFNHDRHIGLASCETCHALGGGKKVDGDFKPVRKETCLVCHNVEKVRQDCLLCHRYHTEPKLVVTAASGVNK